MKTAAWIVAIGLLCAMWGCSSSAGPAVPQATELTQPAGAVPPPPTDVEIQREIERRLPHGPADPRYHDPVLGAANPELAIVGVDGLRLRTWECRSTTYAHGCVGHDPLWFRDPMDTRNDYGRCGDLKPAVCSPLRFVANFVALPVTMVVHPCWQHACTDRTAMFCPVGGRVVPLTAGQPAAGYRPQDFQQVP